MKELVLKSISDAEEGRYRLVFVDENGIETAITCEVDESSGIGVWHNLTKTEPDIFMMGYADMKATGRALHDYRSWKRHGGSEGVRMVLTALQQLVRELEEQPVESKHATLPGYLAAMRRWLEESERQIPRGPSWDLFVEMLRAGRTRVP